MATLKCLPWWINFFHSRKAQWLRRAEATTVISIGLANHVQNTSSLGTSLSWRQRSLPTVTLSLRPYLEKPCMNKKGYHCELLISIWENMELNPWWTRNGRQLRPKVLKLSPVSFLLSPDLDPGSKKKKKKAKRKFFLKRNKTLSPFR
jgi:hypothetical protein